MANDPKPIRVVHWPGDAHDLGVVVRFGRGQYEAVWHDGHSNCVDHQGRTSERVDEWGVRHGPRLPTVTRCRAEVRRAWEWCRAAMEVSRGE